MPGLDGPGVAIARAARPAHAGAAADRAAPWATACWPETPSADDYPPKPRVRPGRAGGSRLRAPDSRSADGPRPQRPPKAGGGAEEAAAL